MKTFSRFVLYSLLACAVAMPLGYAAPMDDDQPHMQAALDALKQAEQHLAEAKHDKGGHRVAALKATREAIRHVEEGMKVADHK